MAVIWLALVGGAAAFAHCLGMCGGFALHLGQGATPRGVLARQMLWHAGRTTTYVFLGAIAGFLGGGFAAAWNYAWLQEVLAYVAGGIMIVMGLVTLGLAPTWRRREADGGGLLASVLGRLVGRPSPGAALAMGLATGLMPCPIVLAFLASAVAGRSVLMGMGTMAALGVGTIWSLLILGLTGHMLTARMRRWGMIVAAATIILLGVATVMRGTTIYHHLLGCPTVPAVEEPGATGGLPASVQGGAEDTRTARPCCGSNL
jgi:sulfite exporter TauE/SafE